MQSRTALVLGAMTCTVLLAGSTAQARFRPVQGRVALDGSRAARARQPLLRRFRSQVRLAGVRLGQRLKGRVSRAQTLLKRRLPFKQKLAVHHAHLVGLLERGPNGKMTKRGNFTFGQQRRKLRILKRAGLSKKERAALMRAGITGGSLAETLVTGAGFAAVGALGGWMAPELFAPAYLGKSTAILMGAGELGSIGLLVGATLGLAE